MATKKSTSKKKNSPAKQSRVKGTISRSLSKKTIAKDIEFSFYAPIAASVGVGGTFNGWAPSSLQLRKTNDGNWKGRARLKPGRYEYRMVVDGRWENDQRECELALNEHGSYNCVLTVA